MGKSLVVKGADFSANGFKYQEIITDASTLYINNDVVATAENWSTLDTSANSKGAWESNSGALAFGGGIKYVAYAKADCSEASKVTVKTIAYALPQSSIYGFAILLFTDASNNIVGGTTNATVGSTSPSGKTTPLGMDNSYKSYEANVPQNAKYVYSVYCGRDVTGMYYPRSPFDDATKFEMKLIKYVRQ